MNKIEQSRQTFDLQAASYDSDFHGEHARNLYPFLLENIIQCSANKLLDLGCGTCALMKQVMDEDHERHIWGIDCSEAMLEKGRQRMLESAELTLGDAHQLPYPNQMFDFVYCCDSFHHYPDPVQVIKEVHRVLKQGGTFLIGDSTQSFFMRWIMNRYYQICQTGDVHMYCEKELRQLMEPYFTDIIFDRVNHKSFIIKGNQR